MSVSRIKHEFRTVLNLSTHTLTKNKVHKILRETEVCSKEIVNNTPTYISNQINLGAYIIRLEFSFTKIEEENFSRLKDYGKFNIRVFETIASGLKEINIGKHPIFKQTKWIKRNAEEQLRIIDLVDVILLCSRLERLKAFN